MMKLHFSGLDEKLEAGLREIAPQLGIELDEKGTHVVVSRAEALYVGGTRDKLCLTYNRDCEFYRALSMIGRALSGDEVRQERRFGMLCYMADQSRNAVFNVESCKRMIRYLALMGYDSMMLYTEDTYEIPEYPYFGRMRGRFSQDELRELDDYADMFGIELIPCIQALAHLGTIFRWPGFSNIRDIDDILLVGDERTYALLDNALKSCAACFRSRRINLGMDEAHALGRGKYLKQNGYEKSSDIMLKHLARVVDLCTDNGFRPMIWSDMFFRMQFGGAYYVSDGEISPEVIEKVPENLALIYWDYYNKDPKRVSHMVHCHKQFNRPIAFAGGAWKWSGPTPHNTESLAVCETQIESCLEGGLTDMIVTAWGDDGAEASAFSVLPCMLYWAERGYENCMDRAKRSIECFDCSYEDLMKFDLPDQLPTIESSKLPGSGVVNPSKYLMFNDPLEGLMDAHVHAPTAAAAYAKHAETLMAKANDKNFGLIFESLGKMCRFLAHKCDFSIRLRNAYQADDRATMKAMAEQEIPQMILLLEQYIDAYRARWYKESKPYGFSVQEQRLGGLRERLLSTARRVSAYLCGEVAKIEELCEPVLLNTVCAYGDVECSYILYNTWAKTSTACVVSHQF